MSRLMKLKIKPDYEHNKVILNRNPINPLEEQRVRDVYRIMQIRKELQGISAQAHNRFFIGEQTEPAE